MANLSEKILIDTCVLLEDPEVITRIRRKNGVPFLAGTVLYELDSKKSGAETINKNARVIFRELSSSNALQVNSLPTGELLLNSDNLSQFSFGGGPVFVLDRQNFRSRTNNDERIIELAKDYDMILITRDRGMKVRADALGVRVVLWSGPQPSIVGKPAQAASSHPERQKIKPFALCTAPTQGADTPVHVRHLPGTGEIVTTPSGRKISLGAQISAGGEGTIFETGSTAEVCKIYHANKLTRLKQQKIELMVSRKINRPGICWPSDLIFNGNNEFVGYLMPKATGKTIQSAMFVKPVLEKTFPNWYRKDLVQLCIAFLEHIRFLHGINVIVGDINPLNFLVTNDSSKLWMVDTDSFQVEGFPCPVGTVNFTAPEIQGQSYSDYLRTKDHELFAVATMIFMLLHPGKPPYSQQGGGSPSDNIKAMDFPYWFNRDDERFSGRNAPQGPWQRIWSNLPFKLRQAFHNTFRLNERTDIDQWLRLLRSYLVSINKDYVSNEIFPAAFRVRDPVETVCGKCEKHYSESEQRVKKMQAQGKKTWCPECTSRYRLERMANQSLKETQQAEEMNRPKASPFSWSAQKPNYASSNRPSTKQTRTNNQSSTNVTGIAVGLLQSIFNNLIK
ncbi:PIN domain-containing protein [Pseudomonas sp. NMI4491_12]|uniref:PIN domain-containing protein n=1 Tax=Pseudomonas sp. NMI4491_12 TaxID=2903146 RepID=UPI001E3D0B47|nr:PIN domain-containing protein [Pseudomonas sp. NMI4491_12]MCE0966721.1 PIN domain-containing protein [Pseudomonas sp. NMI4491_12]